MVPRRASAPFLSQRVCGPRVSRVRAVTSQDADPASALAQALDTDGDGIISAEELAAGIQKLKSPSPTLELDRDLWQTPVDWLPHREAMERLYNHNLMQLGVAAVIVFNFLAIILEKEIDPYPAEFQLHRPVWEAIDSTCNIIFVIEIFINIYGNFWRPFVSNGWNYLDMVVVIVGIISLAKVPLGPFAQIKVLRAFRVLRLFKRIESLNKILVAPGATHTMPRSHAHGVTTAPRVRSVRSAPLKRLHRARAPQVALFKSIPGVINAFVVMLIFMSIYAILAVDLFRDFGNDGDYDTWQRYSPADMKFCGEDPISGEVLDCGCGADNAECATPGKPTFENVTSVSSMTPRGFFIGQEYYGTFSRALYTLFQVRAPQPR